MDSWDAADFGRHFRNVASSSPDETFRQKFGALGAQVEAMDAEFCRETANCGRNLASVMGELESIAGREGYCTYPRGYERDCDALYQDVDRAISHVGSLRETCFI
jgi:hypothetical protein